MYLAEAKVFRIHETLSFISSVLKSVAAQECASPLCSHHTVQGSPQAARAGLSGTGSS